MSNQNNVRGIHFQSFWKIFGLSPTTAITITLLVLANSVSAQYLSPECGTLKNAFGPFDYTNLAHRSPQGNEPQSKLELVEGAHFNSDVENLIDGVTTHGPLGDLEYTLRVFPNHHRALNALANYHIRNSGLRKIGLYSMNCWFDRAIAFRSDDAVARLVYAIYLVRTDKDELALEQYQTALKLQPNSAEANYNIGLLYTDLRNYDLAYKHAARAYELGHPLPGLRNRLQAVGAWKQNPEEQ